MATFELSGRGDIALGWSEEANDLAKDFPMETPTILFLIISLDWYIPEVGTPNVKPQRSVQ